jgi:hypothetical protein
MHPTIAIAIYRFIALLSRLDFLTTRIRFAGEFAFTLGEFLYLHKNSISYFNFNINRIDFIEEFMYEVAEYCR